MKKESKKEIWDARINRNDERSYGIVRLWYKKHYINVFT